VTHQHDRPARVVWVIALQQARDIYLPDSFKNGTQKNADERGFFNKQAKKVFISVFSVHLRPKKGKCQVVRSTSEF
jgi:hypothetical protein